MWKLFREPGCESLLGLGMHGCMDLSIFQIIFFPLMFLGALELPIIQINFLGIKRPVLIAQFNVSIT